MTLVRKTQSDDTAPPPPPAEQRCGTVALLGESNVGKSTLLNRLVGQKLAIVSPKLHSTRRRLLGIVLHEAAQIMFIDTPGLTPANTKLEKAMLHAAYDAGNEADVVAIMVDAAKPQRIARALETMLKNVQHVGKTKILVINKIDLVPREDLLMLSAEINALHDFAATVMISATKDSGLKQFLEVLAKNLPAGPWLYPEDEVTTTPMKVLAAEITREKLYLYLQQELPYACTVQTEIFDESNPEKWHLQQVVTVQKTSQRAIILGHKGEMIKKIGQGARRTMHAVFGVPVDLRLFIKVEKDWQDDVTLY